MTAAREASLGSSICAARAQLVPGGAIDHVTAETLAGAVAAYGLPVEATLAA